MGKQMSMEKSAVEEVVVEETKTNKAKKTDDTDKMINELIAENKMLKEEMETQQKKFTDELSSLKEMLSQVLISSQQKNVPSVKEYVYKEENNEDYDIDKYIRPDKYIKVMSLTPELLNLNAGNGKIIQFHALGETRNVMYGDLVNIVNNHQKLSKEGGFYIFDKEIVAILGLRDEYEKIIDKNGMDSLLSSTPDNLVEVLNSLSDIQKYAIVKYTVKKIIDGANIGYLMTNTINEVCNCNISEMVDEMMHFEDDVKKLESR